MLGGTEALEASPSSLVGLLQGSVRQEEMKGLSIIVASGRAQGESMSLSRLTPSCSYTLYHFYQASKLRLKKKNVSTLFKQGSVKPSSLACSFTFQKGHQAGWDLRAC